MSEPRKRYLLHIGLFLATLVTTTFSGYTWIAKESPDDQTWFELFYEILSGLEFSLPLLCFLTFHEFGHYFTARYNRIKTSLPYYIPFPIGLGTLGAIIRLKEALKSRRQYFDVGIAGPLAGFVVAIGILYYGFTHLPPADYIYEIHPDYEQYGEDYAQHVYNSDSLANKNGVSIQLGTSLAFMFFENVVATDTDRVPNSYEVMHYPWLLAGYISLLFTALNLLPIGQLDGGHIMYGLIGGKRHRIVAQILFIGLLFYAGLGLVNVTSDPIYSLLYLGILYIAFYSFSPTPRVRLLMAVSIFSAQFFTSYVFPDLTGNPGWLLFLLLIGRVLGIYHPPVEQDEPLSSGRKILGWIALVIFIISFSPNPFSIAQ